MIKTLAQKFASRKWRFSRKKCKFIDKNTNSDRFLPRKPPGIGSKRSKTGFLAILATRRFAAGFQKMRSVYSGYLRLWGRDCNEVLSPELIEPSKLAISWPQLYDKR
jgi:hypothetical protein